MLAIIAVMLTVIAVQGSFLPANASFGECGSRFSPCYVTIDDTSSVGIRGIVAIEDLTRGNDQCGDFLDPCEVKIVETKVPVEVRVVD
jgi:hypothetical protein